MTLDEFFAGYEASRPIFDALNDLVTSIGPSVIHVTKSQVAFRHHFPFAWAWIPGRYLRGRGAPLVLSVALGRRDNSSRWKEIVEPSPGRFTHHLELYSAAELDEEVRSRLLEAWTMVTLGSG